MTLLIMITGIEIVQGPYGSNNILFGLNDMVDLLLWWTIIVSPLPLRRYICGTVTLQGFTVL